MNRMTTTRPAASRTVSALTKAAHDNDAPIWSRMEKIARRSVSLKRVVNIKKIAAYTKDGDSVIVPGKVLGTGSIPHKITLYSFSVSKTAAERIIKAGGSVNSVAKAVESHPTGKGLIVLG